MGRHAHATLSRLRAARGHERAARIATEALQYARAEKVDRRPLEDLISIALRNARNELRYVHHESQQVSRTTQARRLALRVRTEENLGRLQRAYAQLLVQQGESSFAADQWFFAGSSDMEALLLRRSLSRENVAEDIDRAVESFVRSTESYEPEIAASAPRVQPTLFSYESAAVAALHAEAIIAIFGPENVAGDRVLQVGRLMDHLRRLRDSDPGLANAPTIAQLQAHVLANIEQKRSEIERDLHTAGDRESAR